MFKRKDNFTDVVEQLPRIQLTEAPQASTPAPSKPSEQQVVSSSGETVTLGNKLGRNKQMR